MDRGRRHREAISVPDRETLRRGPLNCRGLAHRGADRGAYSVRGLEKLLVGVPDHI